MERWLGAVREVLAQVPGLGSDANGSWEIKRAIDDLLASERYADLPESERACIEPVQVALHALMERQRGVWMDSIKLAQEIQAAYLKPPEMESDATEHSWCRNPVAGRQLTLLPVPHRVPHRMLGQQPLQIDRS